MWWAGSEVQVYVTPGRAAVRLPGEAAPLSLEAGDASQAITAAFEAVKAHSSKARRVRLWLAGSLARPFMLAAVAGLRDRAEALNMAQAQAPQQTGLNTPCEVWLDAWQPERDCLAVAVEGSLLALATGEADRCGLRLCAISPAWNAVLTQALSESPPPLLAIQEMGSLILLQVTDQGVTRASFANPPAERVASHVQRSAIGWAVPPEEVVRADIQGLAFETDLGSGTAVLPHKFAVKWHKWADDEATVN